MKTPLLVLTDSTFANCFHAKYGRQEIRRWREIIATLLKFRQINSQNVHLCLDHVFLKNCSANIDKPLLVVFAGTEEGFKIHRKFCSLLCGGIGSFTVWKLRKFTLTIFEKTKAKYVYMLDKSLKRWFHENFSVKMNFSFFQFHTVSFLFFIYIHFGQYFRQMDFLSKKIMICWEFQIDLIRRKKCTFIFL